MSAHMLAVGKSETANSVVAVGSAFGSAGSGSGFGSSAHAVTSTVTVAPAEHIAGYAWVVRAEKHLCATWRQARERT